MIYLNLFLDQVFYYLLNLYLDLNFRYWKLTNFFYYYYYLIIIIQIKNKTRIIIKKLNFKN